MSDSWVDERRRFYAVFFIGSLLGWLTGYWLAAYLLMTVLYLVWHLLQLLQLVAWLRSGANYRKAPDLSGVWELLVRFVYSIQRRHQQRKARFRNLLSRFKDIAAALPDGAIILKSNNEIEWSNEVAEALLGVRQPQDNGQRIDNLIRDPEFHTYLQRAEYDEPLNILSPAAERIELNIRLIPFGDSGELLLMARDISSFMRLQAMRRDFVANVSHELRTPLTVMSGYLEALQEEPDIQQDHQHALRSIDQQSSRMLQIVEDLLKLSRLESKLHGVPDTEVKVPALLGALLNDITHLAAESRHIIDQHIDQLVTVTGSDNELNSLFSNLIHNALRHTPAGTVVKVSWYLDEHQAVFEVEDNGPGIAPEYLPRLTERFYRVDAGRSRDVGGTGLGLSIVKHIVLRHGGDLNINSVVGQGTCFTCRFPAGRTVIDNGFRQQSL